MNGAVGKGSDGGRVDSFSRGATMRFAASLFVLTLTPIASAQTVDFAINPSQTAAISPYIYGINGSSVGAYTNAPFTRIGGNRLTAYNWTNNDSNAGSDWYYQNDGLMSSSTAPGAAMASGIAATQGTNRAIDITVPINGYVSADRLGNGDVRYVNGDPSQLDPNYLSARFKPEQPAKGSAFTTNAAMLQSSPTVYQDEMVNWVNVTYPTSNVFYSLDNEPDLWSSTHAEVHRAPVTYAELLQKTTAYATAIKNVAPNTKIFGPVSYGWYGFTTLQGASDSGANGDFLTYYLNRTAAASKTFGKRLVDVLDLHWYPEAQGAGIRITTADIGLSGGTLAAVMAARIQAPRSLWDSTYVESSWITSSLGGQAINLLPREQAKMTSAANSYGGAYAASKIAITEYNYGGGDDISGGIAQADVLGVFGKQGVFAAAEWGLNPNESFIGGAFEMYRNYDGKGSTFGDISVATTNSNAANASIYASDDSTNSGRMILVAINKTTGGLTAQLSLPNAPDGRPFTEAAIYSLTAKNPTPQFVEDIAITNPVNFSYTMPGYSVTTIGLTVAPIAVWSTVVSGSWSSAGNWTGGVPNAIGAGAVFSISTTAALTITLDKPQTVGTLLLGNLGNASVGYTLTGTGTNTLTLNNSGSGASITVTDGIHAINAPVILADNLLVSGSGTLAFSNSSSITGSYSLTMSGLGTLILSGSDNYAGGTNVTAGTLIVTNNTALPTGTGLTVGAGGTFIFDPSAAGSPVATSSAAAAVPEPSTLALLTVGALGLLGYAWRCRRS